ncbi:putative ribonuclease H-like domain-containing protein [Tanacetum coccineum]
MESLPESNHTLSALNLPILKIGEYDGNAPVAVALAGANGEVPPKTTKELQQRKNELKAKTIKNRFGGNKESKKMQKVVLKQQFESFTTSRGESLDRIYDSFQKLVSQLEIHEEKNKGDLETVTRDDLYHNLKVYEVNTADNTTTTHDQASPSTSTYANEIMCSFFATQSNTPQLDNEDMEQINPDDLEEMDIKWQVVILTMRVKKFMKKTRRNFKYNGKETVGFDKSKVECYNCYKKGHFARECKAPRNTTNSTALIVQDRVGGYDWSFQAEEASTNFALIAYSSLSSSSSSDSEVHTCSKECLKSFETLQKQYDEPKEKLNRASLEIISYQMGLESVEARLLVHEKNEAAYEESIEFLKYDVRVRDAEIKQLKNQLDEISIKSQDTVMSDSEDSTVTYNVAPPSPNYVTGPEYPPSPEFIPEHVYPEFMPPEDDVLPAEEQPLPATVSPIADSPGYVPESDPKEDPEEDDDEDPKEDPADYPTNGGDDGDDEDESSDDDEDNDVDIEGDEEEEEHPTPADYTTVTLPAVDHAPSVEDTKPFETDESAATPPPHPTYWRLPDLPTPPPSPLSPWSSPLAQIPSPPLPLILSLLPVSSPLPVSPPLPLAPPPLGYRAVMIWLRAEAPSTSHSPLPHIILSHTRADTPPLGTPPSGTPPLLPIPLPTSSPPLHLLFTDRRADRLEVTLPSWKRLGIALSLRYEVGESSSAPTARPHGGFRADYGFVATMDREIMRDLERDVSYGITDTWDEMLVDIPGAPATDDTNLGRWMTEFATLVRQDTVEIYTRLDDEQTKQQLMAGSDYRVAGSGH